MCRHSPPVRPSSVGSADASNVAISRVVHLSRIEIRNFRSLYDEGDGGAFTLDLYDGLNLIVGQNNCGKSNVLRAVALALDPAFPFDKTRDTPAQKVWAWPTVTLTFRVPAKTGPEKTLLKYASEYERSLKKSARMNTYADDGEVQLQVQYAGTADGYRRTERIKIRGVGGRQGPSEAREKVLRQLRSVAHFILLESGQSLEAMLEGRFREILNSVIRDHLRDHLDQARDHRDEYVRKLQEELLAPLRDQVAGQLKDVFPEITAAGLTPGVSAVERAIAEVSVELTDSACTPLASKGTGVRGGVLIAMLRYLAAQSRRSMIFAIEEPEAFLHPAAQRALGSNLLNLACDPNVSVIATTHSPFMVPRHDQIKVVSLEKDSTGRTRLLGEGQGVGRSVELLGPLFGNLASAAIFERTTEFSPKTRAVLVVEGHSDQTYLEAAARVGSCMDLIRDVVIEPVNGTTNLLARVSQLLVVAPCSVVVLLDDDEEGRKARKLLLDGLKLRQGEEVLSYGQFMSGHFAWEAEDLFPPALIEKWISEVGEDSLNGKIRRPDGAWHYDIGVAGKAQLAAWIASQMSVSSVREWRKVLKEIDLAISKQERRIERRRAYSQK
jgi:putative ATP-dependent endonuclease of the OLD family